MILSPTPRLARVLPAMPTAVCALRLPHDGIRCRAPTLRPCYSTSLPRWAGPGGGDVIADGFATVLESASASKFAELSLRSSRAGAAMPEPLVGAPSPEAVRRDCPWWRPPAKTKVAHVAASDAGGSAFEAIAGSYVGGRRVLHDNNRAGIGVSRVLASSPDAACDRRRMQKAELERRGWDRWDPPRKLERAAMDKMRELAKELDDEGNPRFTRTLLARTFGVCPEAVRRILRSKWQPTPEDAAVMDERRSMQRIERRKTLCVQAAQATAHGRDTGSVPSSGLPVRGGDAVAKRSRPLKLEFDNTIELLNDDIHVVKVESGNNSHL